MPVFHKAAYQTAVKISNRSIAVPGNGVFEDWNKVFEALDKLTPEERCDALYADWILQLCAPGGQAQLQIRSLLLERGALAANYLAELAQNADDASDGEEARLCVHYRKPWLIVGNNGRKVTSRNLLGLCRFFVHWGRDPSEGVQELNEETIGKFGIGFKSCYRIAREVLVGTWDEQGSYGFRLPIVSRTDDASVADPGRWELIRKSLEAAGESITLTNKQLGYCTPEYFALDQHPDFEDLKGLSPWPRGTLFRFHLHDKGQRELEERLRMGAEGLYELCPLFLPSLREITFGDHRMEFKTTRTLKRDARGLPVETQRATLAIESAEGTGNDRYWLLRSIDPASKWALAIGADSEHRVRTERPNDGGFHLRRGGAYAFFSLNAVSESWNIAVHLHIDLPTNLARSDWNDDEKPRVLEQIEEAAENLAHWLVKRHDVWHRDFSVQDLFLAIPQSNARWAHAFYNAFRKVADSLPVFRAFNGERVPARDARCLQLNAVTDVKAAVRQLSEFFSGRPITTNCVIAWDDIDWNLGKANQNETVQFFRELLQHCGENDAQVRDLTLLLFAVDNTFPRLIESVSKEIKVSKSNGDTVTLAGLLQEVGGAKLTPDWHDLFRFISANAAAHVLNQSAFDRNTRARLRDLSKASETVEWEDVPRLLVDPDAWREKGDALWNATMPPCPEPLKESVLQCLRTKDANGQWEPVVEKWILDTNACQCFLGFVKRWAVELNAGGLQKVRDKLQEWGMWPTYEMAFQKRLEGLSGHVSEMLRSEFRATLSALNHNAFSASLTRLRSSNPGIAALLEEGIRLGLEAFLEAQKGGDGGRRWFVGDGITDAEDSVLRFLGYQRAWKWLDSEARRIYERHGLDLDDFDLVSFPLTQAGKAELARGILLQTWRLKDASNDLLEAAGHLGSWFEGATGNWEVATGPNRREHLRNCAAFRDYDDPLLRLLQNNGQVLDEAKFRLPAALAALPDIRRVAISSESAKIRVLQQDRSQPTSRTQIAPSLREEPLVEAFLREHPEGEVRYLRPLEFEVTCQGTRVFLVQEAGYVDDGKCLYVSRAAVGDDQAYDDLLAVALSFRDNAELRAQREAGKPSREIYQQFRDLIVGVFRKELVTDIGYKKQHILRELLQNAESAYASNADATSGAQPFSASVRQLEGSNRFQVVVEHSGRPFNAPDKDGRHRDDIRRIISVGNAGTERTEGEIGRFNRGFKSLFHVAEFVNIRSGPYDFGIRDLLLMEPSNPKPEHLEAESTSFLFECNARDAATLVGNLESLSIFSPETFVFIRKVTEVELRTDRAQRRWTIQRETRDNGWSRVSVQDSLGGLSAFHVKPFKLPFTDRTVSGGVAFAANTAGLPQPIEAAANRLALTFPTEDPGFGNILLTGEFEADQGRLGVRLNAVAASLLSRALELLREECEDAVTEGGQRAWMAWAEMINPVRLKEEIGNKLSDHTRQPLGEVDAFRVLFERRVPHKQRLEPVDNLTLPSPLLRRVAGHLNELFPPERITSWVLLPVHDALKKWVNPSLEETTLPRWVDETELSEAQSETLATILEEFRRTSTNISARTEIDAALARLRPEENLPPRIISPIAELLDGWSENGDISPYTITGDWWSHLMPNGDGRADFSDHEREKQIRAHLLSPATPEGRLVWYRFLSAAALLSSGRRVSELFRFIEGNPWFPQIWNAKDTASFETAANEAFVSMIRQPKISGRASGEYAYLWRRVFYDLRKIHYIVQEFDFAESVLELCQRNVSAAEALAFMRGGRVNGDPYPWAGVLGQTASSTLLFLLRELRRIEIYRPEDDAHCYFMCRPVRRAAVRFGILEEHQVEETDLDSLLDQAKAMHQFIHSDEQAADVIGDLFDIPFLYYGMKEL